MRVYIAGPMTGYPESNYPAFNAAAARWRAAGWEVENPAEHFGGDQTRSYVEYVDADIVVLKTCDAIAMLPGWDAGHSGAIWENAIARHVLGIPVYDAMGEIPSPDVNNDPRGGEIAIADYDEYRAFQEWRNNIVKWGRSVGKQEAQRRFIDFVIQPTPLTRHPVTGALGRWSNG